MSDVPDEFNRELHLHLSSKPWKRQIHQQNGNFKPIDEKVVKLIESFELSGKLQDFGPNQIAQYLKYYLSNYLVQNFPMILKLKLIQENFSAVCKARFTYLLLLKLGKHPNSQFSKISNQNLNSALARCFEQQELSFRVAHGQTKQKNNEQSFISCSMSEDSWIILILDEDKEK